MTVLAAVLDLDAGPFESGLRKASGLARGAAGAIAGVFVTGAAAATAFAGAVAGAAVKATADFEARLANVNTLLTGTAEGSLQRLREGILALPPELGSATELTDGLYQALSAGTRPAEAVDRVAQSAKLARAGLADLGVTTKALSGFINAYGEDSVDAATASDLLFTVVQRGVFELPELATQLGRISTTASAAGVSQVELTAALANITKTGLPARQAVSGLSAALSNIIKPSTDAVALSQELGVEFSAAAVQSKGLAGVLAEVEAATGGNVDQLAKFFGSVEGVNAVLALTKGELAGFQEDLDAFGAAAAQGGAITERAFQKQAATFTAQLQTIRNGLNRILIDIGTPLLAEIKKVTQGVIDNLDTIRPTVVGVSRTIIRALGVAGSAVGDIFQSVNALVQGNLNESADAATEASNTIANAFAQAFPNVQQNLDALLDAALFTFDEIALKSELGARAIQVGFLASVRGAVAVFENVRMVAVGFVADIGRAFADIGKAYALEQQAIIQTTVDLGTAVTDVFFQTARAANTALGGIGDVAVSAVETAIRQIGAIASSAGEQLLASGIPGIAAAGQGLRLLAVDIQGAASTVSDSLGTVEARNAALVDSQVAVFNSLQNLVPTGDQVAGVYEGVASTLEGLAEPSQLVGAAIADINESIRGSVEGAKAAKAELDALRGGQEFGGAGFTGLDLSLPGAGGGGRAGQRQAEDEAVATAAQAGQDKLNEITGKGTVARDKLERDAQKKRLSAAGSFFNSLTQIAGNRSQKLFKISQAVNVATATGNAFASFNEALKNPPGPPFTVPIAAAALASGLAQVASIKSQNVPAFQQGGRSIRGGTALVGESGRELVELPAGARVRPNGVTERLLGDGPLFGDINVNIPGGVTQDSADEQASMFLTALARRLERGENPEFIDAVERARANA